MGRRKQSQPVGHLGKVESRPEDPDEDYDILDEEFALLEDRRAMYERPRKKRKIQGVGKMQQQVTEIEISLIKGPGYILNTIQISENKSVANKKEGDDSKVVITKIKKHPHKLNIQGALFKGVIEAPSAETADALFSLLKDGHITATASSTGAGSSKSKSPAVDQLSLALSQQTLDSAAEDPNDEYRPKWQLDLLQLLAWLTPTVQEDSIMVDAEGDGNFDAGALYAAIKPSGTEPELPDDFPELKPTLRAYQRRAAAWMVSRERKTTSTTKQLHPLWTRVDSQDGVCFYINPVTGRVSLEEFTAPNSPSGGILADQMGLGKTVEVLTLVLANKFTGKAPILDDEAAAPRDTSERIDCVCGLEDPHYDGMWLQCDDCNAWLHAHCIGYKRKSAPGAFVCAPCLRYKAEQAVTKPCGTTLIVCPFPILHQWYSEIMKHIEPGSLKVLIYEGQSQPSPGVTGNKTVISASDLAAADIVLCSYDTLRKDVYHNPDSNEGSSRSLRRKKRYEVIPTPLTRLVFWRVCLDESQMIESSTAKAAEMALKLKTEHRWCVTGTPVSRGLDDLFGLIKFLRAAPYDDKFWWKQLISKPYESGQAIGQSRLIALLKPSLGGLMWRCSKADVADELALPTPTHNTLKLLFSAIERHFYSRQHNDCVGAARDALPDGVLVAAIQAAASDAFEDRPLSHKELDKLLIPLLKLRQACVHPQVGAGGIKQLSHTRKPMTMGEVLDVLVTKAKVEAEDAQRFLVAALNGLSGLYQLQEDWVQAVGLYRQVLQLVESNKEWVHTDSLQRLHTLWNLAELLEGPAKDLMQITRTLRDGDFKRMAQELRDEYMVEPLAALAEAEKEYIQCKEKLEDLEKGLKESHGEAAVELMHGWWVGCIKLLCDHGNTNSIVDYVKDQLRGSNTYAAGRSQVNAAGFENKFRDLHGLQVLIDQGIADMERIMKKALSDLDRMNVLVANPSPQLVHLAGSCDRCRGQTAVAANYCQNCKIDDSLSDLEVRLYDSRVFTTEVGTNVTLETAAKTYREYNQNKRVDRIREVQGSRRGEGAVAATNVFHSAGQVELALRSIYTQLRTLKVPTNLKERKKILLAAAKTHLDILEHHRKQTFGKALALSAAQRPKLFCLDELDMCTTKLSFRTADDVWVQGDDVYKVNGAAEIPGRMALLCAEKTTSEGDLNRAIGKVRYLEGLKAEQQAKEAAAAVSPVKSTTAALPNSADGAGSSRDMIPSTTDVCPVCQDTISNELVVMVCGHKLCCPCSLRLVERLPAAMPAKYKVINCPTCRTKCNVSDLSYVTTHASNIEQDEGDLRVRGSYGTKIEAVVRRLLYIHRENPDDKVLVFSQWKDALELLSHALDANNINHLFPRGPKQFDKAITAFRHDCSLPSTVDAAAKANGTNNTRKKASKINSHVDDQAAQVLLLQVLKKGNGINLQTANHIIFVEPVLDPSEAAQAVGRIDRMGQNKSTFIHRFVVKNTIEENVHVLGEERASHMDLENTAVVANKSAALTLRDVAVLLQQGSAEVYTTTNGA